MGSGPDWSKAETEYLQEAWGTVSVPTIAKNMNRPIGGIINKARRLKLGPALENGTYITLNQLHQTFIGGPFSYNKIKSWITQRNIPVHTKRVNNCSFKIVYIDEFWKWAERHRVFLDFSRLEKNALGTEPEWVDEQRRADIRKNKAIKKSKWTPDEDAKLMKLLKEYKYTYAEIAKKLSRGEGAVARRCVDLGVKERPLRADPHAETSVWTENDISLLAECIRKGMSYYEISQMLGKSEKACRGKVSYVYFTENLDKVRAILGNGKWGCGVPEPRIKQVRKHSGFRQGIKKDLTSLVTVLRYRMNELGYDGFWQRHSCMNWDDIKGCTAGGTDCDSCIEFRRVQPQYCSRCGKTFFERKEQKFCAECRAARKKQAQKHYARSMK